MRYKEGRLLSSYSQIDMFLQCPYRWYLQYVLGKRVEGRYKALEYGSAVHETLEVYFDNKQKGAPTPKDELIEIYDIMFDMHRIPFDNEEEKKLFHHEGLVMINRLYSPVNEMDKLLSSDDVEILGVEMELDLEFPIKPVFRTSIDENGEEQEEEFETAHIVGFIDLVLRTKDGIIIIDHKSGKNMFKKDKLETNLQFPIYAMAVMEKFGEMPHKCMYNFTKVHDYQEVIVDEKRIQESRKEIIKILNKMGHPRLDIDGSPKFTAKPQFLCGWCDYSSKGIDICEPHRKYSKFRGK